MNLVSHLFCRAHKGALGARVPQGHFSQRQAVGLGVLLDLVAGALLAVAPQVAQVGERRVQRVLGKVVVVERPGQCRNGVLDGYQCRQLLVLALGLLDSASHYGTNAGQQEHLGRIAPLGSHTGLHIAVVGLGFFQRIGVKEYGIGPLCSKALAVF